MAYDVFEITDLKTIKSVRKVPLSRKDIRGSKHADKTVNYFNEKLIILSCFKS